MKEKNKMQKKVLAINDISCTGRCSLTVALPIVSAAGLETVILPTAVLSTHTSGFQGYTFLDFTEEMRKITAHWKTLDLKFNGIYTGYLGSKEQLEIVAGIIKDFSHEGTLVFVDPVMGDDGKLYPGFDSEFPKGMKTLCDMADVIVPNITEASLMAGMEYKERDYDKAYIETLSRKLSDNGPKTVIISGVSFEKGKIGCAMYDRDTDTVTYGFTDFVASMYHGTGDVFSSALFGALASGKDVSSATEIAMNYTKDSIFETSLHTSEKRFGVEFEAGLGKLADTLSK